MPPRIWFFLVLAAVGLVTACSSDSSLGTPAFTNAERTDTLYALLGTPVQTPSAYSIQGSRRVRTDTTSNFDFTYNIQLDGSHVFVPQAVLGIEPTASVNPGLLLRTETYDAITEAPSNGYVTDQVVPRAVGDRYAISSR